MFTKTKLSLFAVFMATLVLLSSCSTSSVGVSKRRYNKGYFVNITKDKKVTTKATPAAPAEKKADVVVPGDEMPVAVENETKPVAVEPQELVASVTPSASKSSSLKNRVAMKMAEKVLQNTPAQAFVEQAKSAEVKAAPDFVNTTNSTKGDDIPVWLLYVLAIVFPPIAVGLATDWETKPLIVNIILCVLSWLPGIIHALIVVNKNK